METKKKDKVRKVKREKSKIFSHRINEVMVAKGMCSKELADLIDTPPSHICRILQSKRPCISLPIAMKISEALKTPIEQLFQLDKPKQIKKS